jgi:CRP-like cAMP-binding protein
VSALPTLRRDRRRSSGEARRLAEKHLADVKARMAERRAVARTNGWCAPVMAAIAPIARYSTTSQPLP